MSVGCVGTPGNGSQVGGNAVSRRAERARLRARSVTHVAFRISVGANRGPEEDDTQGRVNRLHNRTDGIAR